MTSTYFVQHVVYVGMDVEHLRVPHFVKTTLDSVNILYMMGLIFVMCVEETNVLIDSNNFRMICNINNLL